MSTRQRILLVYSILAAAYTTGKAAPGPTFFWDFETATPNICSGGDCHPHYDAMAGRSMEQAAGGSWSLKTDGEWSQAGVWNESNDHIWAPMTEGTVEFDWQYVAPFSSRMLFQFSGRWDGSSYDHNDAIKLIVRYDNQLRVEMGYSTVSNSYKTPFLRANLASPLVDGQWYHITCKYKQGVGIELTVDDQVFIQSDALDGIITEDRAWHLIVMGNDLSVDCVQYLDNFTVYDHWTQETAIKGLHDISESPADLMHQEVYGTGLLDMQGKQMQMKNAGSGIYYTYDRLTGRPAKMVVIRR